MPDADKSPWEQVLVVWDVYDGMPRDGVALFRGRPHSFKSDFFGRPMTQTDNDLFHLMEISPALAALAVEQHALWERWIATTPRGAGPVLQEDLPRHAELSGLIGDQLQIVPERAIRLRGAFGLSRATSYYSDIVRWLDVDGTILNLAPITGRRLQSGPLPNENQHSVVLTLLRLVEADLVELGARELLTEVSNAAWSAFIQLHNQVWYDGMSDDDWHRALVSANATTEMWHAAVQAYSDGGPPEDLLTSLSALLARLPPKPARA